jgi:DNA-binding response OmpR family regulator
MAKVMLVEDEPTMLSLLRTLLQIEGFEVAQLERDDSLDGIIDSIRREKPAAILLDVNLRQVNGFDVLQRLRSDAELKPIRVVMSSGMDYQMRCAQEGADDFILKPYMPEELIKKIHNVTRE